MPVIPAWMPESSAMDGNLPLAQVLDSVVGRNKVVQRPFPALGLLFCRKRPPRRAYSGLLLPRVNSIGVRACLSVCALKNRSLATLSH